MDFRYAISLVFDAHLPFIREYGGEENLQHSGKESRFFEYVSETLLPLLEVLNRLENDRIPFRLGLVISPILCHLLSDEMLQKKYLHYVDKQIEFGSRELTRIGNQKDNPHKDELYKMAQDYYDIIVERRIAYTERYEKNLLKAFDFFKRRGKIEIIATCATNAFLPFLSGNGESLQAQMEIPVSAYRRFFGSCPQGFWLPCLGWTSAIEPYLRDYNYSYTIIDSHGLLFGTPAPEKGNFYPVKTPNGTYILTRDLFAVREIEKIASDDIYRSNHSDIGYELPPEEVSEFLNAEGGRSRTGYKYWARASKNGKNKTYNPQAANEKITKYAKLFLENITAHLESASAHMKEPPISLLTQSCDFFGRFWHEGPRFIETLFRMAADKKDVKLMCPSEYIFKQELSSLQVVSPEFSSGGIGGYAESWLDVSNDWIYRHLNRAMERMTELAERFPDDTGLKERALNQAAREILLAQSSDWAALLHKQDSTEYAHNKAENSLRNFTTIYESLGSNYISTEWLTTLERRHNIFPGINYRVFRRKK